ncbi:hypothetical protein [Paenibacillus sp. y28]|uniref:hypothetical protein n=1 Tax=Paenibacillus sp. y28 TaxID=3129110 RepID=UPI003018D165
MDFLIGKLTWLLDKYAGQMSMPSIPYSSYSGYLAVMQPYISEANVLFPVDDILLMLSIILGIRAVLWIIWGVVFIRNLLPF